MSQVLQHPVSHNIEWRAAVSLLQAVAQVEETALAPDSDKLGRELGPSGRLRDGVGDQTPWRSRSEARSGWR